MPSGDKPYRVYKGGRTKGSVPLKQRPQRGGRPAQPEPQRPRGPGPVKRSRRKGGWKRRTAIALAVLLVLLVAWGAASFLSFRKGVAAANARLAPEAVHALDPQDGLLLSNASNTLLLGTDHAATPAREGDQHSDSIMLVHTDPRLHRLAFLSIPRDLRVPIPGHGDDKINAAFQIGGPALAIQTVKAFTGLPVNHLVLVDFANFQQLIDRLGGITVDVPAPILSNRFDCPFATDARCQRWPGWRFRKGTQHMDGHRALIYSRIRENRLNPAESDVTRGERQQRVLQALSGKLASPGTMLKLPWIGGDLLRPLATDLSAGQFLQLAWLKFRAPAGRALHCRLGGTASDIGGQSVIVSTEENLAVVRMVTGESAPQPPPPGSGPYGPGCVIGSRALK